MEQMKVKYFSQKIVPEAVETDTEEVRQETEALVGGEGGTQRIKPEYVIPRVNVDIP